MKKLVQFSVIALLAGCGPTKQINTATLYRNSPILSDLRVYWASFAAPEENQTYNIENCEMAAGVLNANFKAMNKANGKEPDPGLGFWCEEGPYSEKGNIPTSFKAEFPTDVTGPYRF